MEKIQLSPYYLKRICSKALNNDRMSLCEINIIQDDIRECYNFLELNIEKLDEQIYSDIGMLKDEEKKKAVNIRRTLRKKKFRNVNFENIAFLSDKSVEIADKCQKIIEVIHCNKKKQEELMLSNKESAFKKIIDELDNNYFFRNALMIAMNTEAYGNLQDLLKADNYPNEKKYRDTILSIENYYNRMLHKPSPFSTFVNIQLGAYEHNGTVGSGEVSHNQKVYLNLLFLYIVESLMLEDNSNFLNCFFIKANPTIIQDETFTEYVNVDVSNPKYLFYKEAFCKIKTNEKINSLLSILKGDNLPLGTLVSEYLSSCGSPDSEAKNTIILILKLANAGLLYKNFNIDSIESDHLSCLIEMCDKAKDEKYACLKRELSDIRDNLKKLNESVSDIDEREQIRALIYENIDNAFKIFSLNAADMNFKLHNIIYENDISPYLDRNEKALNEEEINKMNASAILYRIFDNNFITKILYRDIFLKKYNKDQKVALTSFYKDVTEFTDTHDTIENDDDIASIRRMRNDFFSILKNNIENDVINISSEDIFNIYKDAPDMMKLPKSFGVYYQKDGNNIIVNNTAPGFGRHFMRYVDGMNNEEQKDFLDKYKKNFSTPPYGKLYDIGTNLGLNINQHICCLENSLQYPSSVYMESFKSVKPENYYVAYDEKYNTLCIENENGEKIEVTPIGFLFSRVAPGYYRYLSAFSNSQGAEISIWDRFASYYNEYEKIKEYPRIILDGNIVLERKTWKISCEELKNNYKDISELNEFLKLTDFMIGQLNIPKEFFLKITSDIDGLLFNNENINDKLDDIKNKRLRKPQFYDLDNYIDFKNFINMINNHNGIVTIQEVYPNNNEIIEYLAEFSEIK